MSAKRKELQTVLCRYVRDTLTNIDTVKTFCEKSSKWIDERKGELNTMTNIKDRADKMNLDVSHVTQSESKFKASLQFMKNKIKGVESEEAELEKELAAVVEETLRGLKELDYFLDAVEKLAVTSHHVFTENQVMSLPTGINKEDVEVVVITARLICPLLLEFKRDAETFFKPKLENIEVLMYQLDRYIKTTETICGQLEKSFSDFKSTMSNKTMVQINKDLSEDDVEKMFNHINQLDEIRSVSDFNPKLTMETVLNPDVDLSDDDVHKMHHHINQLDEIRKNQPFRMVFLFQEESCSDFINEFEERQPRMLQFLNELEDCAVQLDRMNKGSKISSVVGSSVGAVGGILSIVGLALIPVTAGASLVLTMTGMGLGITSGVNSAVTTATEVGVNKTQQTKANEAFKSFMEDVQSLLVHLENVINQTISKIAALGLDMAVGVSKIVVKVGTVGKTVDSLIDTASAIKVWNMSSDIPEVGQAAAKGILGLSKSARAGLIAVNGLFLGLDVIFICKDSISLAKGSETKVSQIIRARAALWSSEMNSWQKIHDSLCQGLKTSEEHKAVLEKPFYPDGEI